MFCTVCITISTLLFLVKTLLKQLRVLGINSLTVNYQSSFDANYKRPVINSVGSGKCERGVCENVIEKQNEDQAIA